MGGGAGVADVSMNGQQGFSASQLIDPNALPDWMKAQAPGTPPTPGMPPSAAHGQAGQGVPGVQQGWSASNLIDPSALPGWVQGAPGAQGVSGMQGSPPAANAAPRANPDASRNSSRHRAAGYEQGERDFGASRAGTAQQGAISRKYPSARPLDENEKPEWLREDGPEGYPGAYPDGYGDGYAAQGGREGREGRPDYPGGRQERNGRSLTGNDGYDGQDAYGQSGQYGRNRQNGQNGQNGQRRPRGQTEQSWAAPDGYEASPWSRPRPTRQQVKPGAKKRRGGFFGFLRRG